MLFCPHILQCSKLFLNCTVHEHKIMIITHLPNKTISESLLGHSLVVITVLMVMCAGFSRDTQLVKCRQKPQSIVKYDIMSIIDFQVLLSCIYHKYLMTGVEVWPDWDGTGTWG